MPSQSPEVPLKIFYDAGCKVCAWEIDQYLKKDKHHKLSKIDINDPKFDASAYHLSANDVKKYFHVLTPEGKVIAGVDAFIEIWKTLDTPISSVAAVWAKKLPFHTLLKIGYFGFIQIRPFLPRNKNIQCDDDSCKIN